MKNMKFNVDVFTLFPEAFPVYFGLSNSGKALEKGLWLLNVIDIREYSEDKHKRVDDTPFGGGAGMVMKCDVLGNALEAVPNYEKKKVYYLSPRGEVLTQKKVEEIKGQKNVVFICGHYEGVDQRFLDYYEIEEISIGDYVLSGGEIACQVCVDAVVRLLDGVIDSPQSHQEESFGIADGNLLEYPHYTRPVEWKCLSVPEVLVSGHHKKIEEWKLKKAEEITKERRRDLWNKYKK